MFLIFNPYLTDIFKQRLAIRKHAVEKLGVSKAFLIDASHFNFYRYGMYVRKSNATDYTYLYAYFISTNSEYHCIGLLSSDL